MNALERKESHSNERLQAGDTLGRYQLLCPIARGGMGQVWAARQTGRLGLPKLVAIKTAIPLESKDFRQMENFLFDEAHVAASIDHPNVCKILELGQERDVLFIAMEWLNGVPLSTFLTKLPERRLSYRIAAHLVAQACSGLHAAHELTDDDGVRLEVVHRDATPHNFMITSMGELKVMDFGIVKSKNQQHQATQTGELKGKISYLAPEQIRSGVVDCRTDIFTLGCVLYVATVGKVAFNPDTDQDAGRTMLRIIYGDDAPPSSILPEYPPELEAIVQRALATSPADRFQTAEEMRLALESYLADGSRTIAREDVAAVLNVYCGQAIEQRRWEIRTAQKFFDSQSGEMRSGAYPVAERVLEVSPPLAVGTQSNLVNAMHGSGSLHVAPTIRPTQGANRVPWPILVGAGLLAALATMVALRTLAFTGSNHAVANATTLQPVRDKPLPSESPAYVAQTQTPPPPKLSQTFPESVPSALGVVVTARPSPKAVSRHASAKAVVPSAETNSGGSEVQPAPNPSSSLFTQSVLRKPPRHVIDESDPFEK